MHTRNGSRTSHAKPSDLTRWIASAPSTLIELIAPLFSARSVGSARIGVFEDVSPDIVAKDGAKRTHRCKHDDYANGRAPLMHCASQRHPPDWRQVPRKRRRGLRREVSEPNENR